ncbi:MAG TPA: hypothetical protein VNT27_04615, partial [Propionibacteriaceae bacterium]|nr:hypothetical protein [Propionibacteriaceae bacterium]
TARPSSVKRCAMDWFVRLDQREPSGGVIQRRIRRRIYRREREVTASGVADAGRDRWGRSFRGCYLS